MLADAPFSLGEDLSSTELINEVVEHAQPLPLPPRMDAAKPQEDPDDAVPTDHNVPKFEMSELRVADDQPMTGPRSLSPPPSAQSDTSARPDVRCMQASPEALEGGEGGKLNASAVLTVPPDTALPDQGGHNRLAALNSNLAQPPVDDGQQTATQSTDKSRFGITEPAMHRAPAPPSVLVSPATQPPLPTATSTVSERTILQATQVLPMKADQGAVNSELPSTTFQSATGSPEAATSLTTQGTPSNGLSKTARHTAGSDDPVQPSQSERLPQDKGSYSEAKATQPHSSPSLSRAATPAVAGSPNSITASILPFEDLSATVETVAPSDELLPELNAPHFRDMGQAASQPRLSPELPRLIAAQLADVVRSHPEKPVELTLNPEELGRVRMSFQSDAATLSVILQVERPETLDLMRRHIDQLAQDMHELGYAEVSFSFQQHQQNAASNGQSPHPPQQQPKPRVDIPDPPGSQDVIHLQAGNATGVDIRI